MGYNLVNLTTAGDLYQYTLAASRLSYNGEPNFFLGYIIVFLSFIGLFILMKQYDTMVALISSSFITMLITIVLASIGIAPWTLATIFVTLLLVGIIIFIFRSDQG